MARRGQGADSGGGEAGKELTAAVARRGSRRADSGGGEAGSGADSGGGEAGTES